jgi:hypothetical protein
MRSIARPWIMLCVAGMGGCAPFDDEVGTIQRHNIAQQVVNPHPAYRDDQREGDSGRRGADAVARLEAGAARPPVAATTTGSLTGQGGSAAGGAK